ncbi:MAG: amidohydrolase [Actinobacteria bacterium]|nr:amidohydrolase [Actinomycetota bacterium]
MTATSLRSEVTAVLPQVTEIRRRLHSQPELSYGEFETTRLIAATVREAGLEPRLRTPHTGLLVDVGGPAPDQGVVGFRADLDALPIQEPEGLEYRSVVPGVMHACGHDVHAAIGTGLALLADRLGLKARFIFQPAEEAYPGGGEELVGEGAALGLSSVIAFHCDPSLEAGRVGFRPGPITASADRFFITLEGPGGHTARPHRTVDLVYAAGLLATQLPGHLDRLMDARLPKSVVFGKIAGGTAVNVIPSSLEMSGTCRTLDRGVWEDIPSVMERLVHEIVAPAGPKVVFSYQRGIPPVINDEQVVAVCMAAVTELLGPEAVAEAPTSMGAEDFSRFTQAVPGSLIRLGVKGDHRTADLHSSTFRADEGALETGLLAGIASLLALAR